MNNWKKDVFYIISLLALTYGAFMLGIRWDDKCYKKQMEIKDNSWKELYAAATEKYNFCIKNKPSLEDLKETVDKYRLYKEIRCPEKLLYKDCDQQCKEDAVEQIRIDLIAGWDEE